VQGTLRLCRFVSLGLAALGVLLPAGVRAQSYVHTRLEAGVGRGLRLNNPYRLQTQLGSTAESLSATATYLDVRALAQLGDPAGWHHGLGFSAAVALQGLEQEVLTPAWVTSFAVSDWFWLSGHAGAPLVIRPDFNAGIELGAQACYWVRSGIGTYASVVWDQFWGAATDQTAASWIPIVALQAGVSLRYEVLP
jgi:hypothetical protein